MASKSSIHDVARVDLPMPETDRIAKLVPTHSDFDLTDYLNARHRKTQRKTQNEQAMEHIKCCANLSKAKVTSEHRWCWAKWQPKP
ncbi:MAG: hypothetical protein IPL35_04650 [Sphingobacteriales bacterium]|nr:hypothetical protein [Sphingobacteriales bacterium]